MSKKAISAGTDKSGGYHVFAGPDVPYQNQKAAMKELIAKDGKVTPIGSKKSVQLEDWCLYLQTAKRFRRRRGGARGLVDPQVQSDIQA